MVWPVAPYMVIICWNDLLQALPQWELNLEPIPDQNLFRMVLRVLCCWIWAKNNFNLKHKFSCFPKFECDMSRFPKHKSKKKPLKVWAWHVTCQISESQTINISESLGVTRYISCFPKHFGNSHSRQPRKFERDMWHYGISETLTSPRRFRLWSTISYILIQLNLTDKLHDTSRLFH